LLKLVGSSDLFGNPNAMNRSFGQGKKEFSKLAKIRPRDGLKSGFVQGGSLLMQSANHTVAGASGGFSRIS